jgi:enamine deaminase RidA (YjgF/YER057c/UK114 family)
MPQVEDRLAELGLEIPEPPPPLANYVAAVRTGNLVFVAGHGPRRDGEYAYVGKLGEDLAVQEGYDAARVVILNCLASLKAEIGDLDKVRRIVKMLGMVNSATGFHEQPAVINGASDLLVELFGDKGRHARSAVGMAALPMGIAVEIELVVEVAD